MEWYLKSANHLIISLRNRIRFTWQAEMEIITSNIKAVGNFATMVICTQRNQSNSSIFWVCTNRRSGCRGSARTDSGITDIIVNNAHGHLLNEVNIDLAKVRAAMKESARDSNEKTSVIYARALQNVDDNTMAALPSADICKRSSRKPTKSWVSESTW